MKILLFNVRVNLGKMKLYNVLVFLGILRFLLIIKRIVRNVMMFAKNVKIQWIIVQNVRLELTENLYLIAPVWMDIMKIRAKFVLNAKINIKNAQMKIPLSNVRVMAEKQKAWIVFVERVGMKLLKMIKLIVLSVMIDVPIVMKMAVQVKKIIKNIDIHFN